MESYYFQVHQADVGYDHEPVVRDINIQLKKGEILTLIGANGAGKSTVLKSIARQLSLKGGAIYLNQESLKKIPREKLAKKMAVVFTERLYTDMMTCEDVVATGRYPYTGRFGILTPKDKELVGEAINLVHAASIREQDFRKISDGQRQRIMLARAICQEPEILLLDEPTMFLDIRHKLEFLSILQEMTRKRQLTVIMSLHELDLAERVSDKVLCIKDNLVDAYGTPEQVLQQGYVQSLFDIESGSYDEISGNPELEPPRGEAEIFVIAGGGSGKAVYRRLQREGKAFKTGILYQNDLDYPVAVALAEEVIAVKEFTRIQEEDRMLAQKALEQCKTVICCRDSFGELEKENEALLMYAIELKKEIVKDFRKL